MQSELVPGVVYRDTSRDITENDLDVVSDLWTINGRNVYRGSRDPRYAHANVYWLYSEDLERIGLCEHALADHADFRVLWFRDTDFGTYLQEDGWEQCDDIWSHLPRHVFDRCINEGWTTPLAFLEQCLYGPVRVFTPEMAETIPIVYTCATCGKRSLHPLPACSAIPMRLDFPNTEKVFFVDSDFITYRPPASSRVWDLLTLPPSHDGDSQQAQGQEQQPKAHSPRPPAGSDSPPDTLPAQPVAEPVLTAPPQSHP